METIANDGATSSETVSPPETAPYRVLVECAPRPNGDVWVRELPQVWEDVATRLADAGRRRAIHSSARGPEGLALLRQAWEEIRTLWFDEAKPLGMPMVRAAELVGLSRAQLDSVLKGKVGGKGIRAGTAS